MMTPHTISVLISAVLGFFLAIPLNTCIVIVNLRSLRKEGKLSPSDVIFMVKGMVNIPLQAFLCVQGISYLFLSATFCASSVYLFMMVFFLTYFSFWLTAWLSAHYCTTITNLNYRLFIWIKRILSNFLSQVLLLTALGIFPVSVLSMWTFTEDCQIQHSNNSTEASMVTVNYIVNYPYMIPVTFLGVILPFCLSLLCLLLTLSFLVRHVWRVINNDSGSSRPNLQAHVTALRTIFFLLLMFASFCMSRVIIISRNYQKSTIVIDMISWIFRLLSPLIEAAVFFQASNKLRRIILTGFRTRTWRNAET